MTYRSDCSPPRARTIDSVFDSCCMGNMLLKGCEKIHSVPFNSIWLSVTAYIEFCGLKLVFQYHMPCLFDLLHAMGKAKTVLLPDEIENLPT